jgi:ABC-2 type transport system ATP-binding protein
VLGEPLGHRGIRARIGFLPEHFRFQEALTGRELLRFHGRLHGIRGSTLDARVDELLARVDLLDAADRPIQGYSKGMTQRAGLAQALINRPDLVFLDEPTSGLDPLGRLLVRDIMADLRVAGTTVFLNSHLLGEVEATCDRVAFVKQGRIVQEMPLASPAARELDLEIRVTPVNACILEGLARFGCAVAQVGVDRVHMRVVAEDVLPDMTRWLVAQGAALYELRAHKRSLEELFVEVMGRDQRPG